MLNEAHPVKTQLCPPTYLGKRLLHCTTYNRYALFKLCYQRGARQTLHCWHALVPSLGFALIKDKVSGLVFMLSFLLFAVAIRTIVFVLLAFLCIWLRMILDVPVFPLLMFLLLQPILQRSLLRYNGHARGCVRYCEYTSTQIGGKTWVCTGRHLECQYV